MKEYSFSLVIPTINRASELVVLLESLKRQTYAKYEVIIIDQNKNGLLNEIAEKYAKEFRAFKYVRSEKPGAAYNRNFGATFAKNEIVTFPDDDCIYKPDTLEKINAFINQYDDFDFFTCNLEYLQSHKCRYVNTVCPVTFWNVPERSIESTFFYKNSSGIELFDADFGVGSVWGSNEIVDLIWNNLSKGKKGVFNGTIAILHPDKSGILDEKRLYNYALGFGASYKKAFVEYGQWLLLLQFLKYVFRNFCAVLISVKKRRFYLASLRGKLNGFLSYKKKGGKK